MQNQRKYCFDCKKRVRSTKFYKIKEGFVCRGHYKTRSESDTSNTRPGNFRNQNDLAIEQTSSTQFDQHQNKIDQFPLFLNQKKRRPHFYSVSHKLHILNTYEKFGTSYACNLYAVNSSMISKWKNQKGAMKKMTPEKKRKKSNHQGQKTKLSESVENQIMKEINMMRSSYIPVTGAMIKTLSLKYSNDPYFKASNAWLEHFTLRHQLTLRQGTKRVPKLSQDLAQKLKEMHKEVYDKMILNNYHYIINIDETPIFWGLNHQKTYSTKGAKEVLVNKYQNDKKRITVILAIVTHQKFGTEIEYNQATESNDPSPNTKLNPMVIFREKTERCIRGVSDNEILMNYQEKAWCDTKKYCDYIQPAIIDTFPQKRILLIHDGFEAHNCDEVKKLCHHNNIDIYTLPPNSTCASQPLDLCLNKPFKHNVKNAYNQHLVQNTPRDHKSLPQIQKTDLIKCVKSSWHKIENQTIRNSFRVCGLGVSRVEDHNNIYCKKLDSLKNQFENWKQQKLTGVQQILEADIFCVPSADQQISLRSQ
jgi:hypothetical protein